MKNPPAVITGDENPAGLDDKITSLVRFYHAFNHAQLNEMQSVWATEQNCIMANPLGGIKRGWSAIQEVYQRIFSEPGKVYVEYYDFSIVESDRFFYASGRERGYLRAGPEDKLALDIRTSRVFINIDRQWKQIHHHGSIDNPELLASYQRAV